MVAAGVPTRTPEAIVGGRSSYGTVLRLTVISDLVQPLLHVLAGELAAAQVELHEMRVRAAGEHLAALPMMPSASAVAFALTARWYSRKARSRRSRSTPPWPP